MNTESSSSNTKREDLQSETDNWLNAHRDQRSSSSPAVKKKKSQTVVVVVTAPENELSDSITSINMAGEIQKLSADNGSDSPSNQTTAASKKWEEEEKKEDEEILPTSETSKGVDDSDDQADDVNKEQREESSQSVNDQRESDAMNQLPQEEKGSTETETRDEESVTLPEGPPDNSSDNVQQDQVENAALDQPLIITESENSNNDEENAEVPMETSDNHQESEEVSKLDTSFDSQESESAPLLSPTSAPPETSSSSSVPNVETVTSMESLDLLRTKTNSNAEVIEDTKLSATAVVSSDGGEQDQPPAVAVAVDQKSSETNQDDQGSMPSLAARAAAAATGILPALSNLSASPKSSPRTSSPNRSSPTAQDGNDQASSEKPSLAARAAAAAAAAAEATGIMPVLSNMSGSSVSNTPRVSPSRSTAEISAISAARTWPDESHLATGGGGGGEDTFFDNGQAVPRPAPSPPSSDVGVGGRVPQFKFPAMAIVSSSKAVTNDDTAAVPTAGPEDDEKSNLSETSPLLASPQSRTDPDGVEAAATAGGDEEAQVLSVVPTVIETDAFEDKEDDKAVTRELLSPAEESTHEFKEVDEDDSPPSRCSLCLRFLKTKKGIAIVVVFLLLALGIGLGVGLAPEPEISYCEAARKGYSIPNEGNYRQLDFNWMLDVSTTGQWDRSTLVDINTDFQSIVIPTMAGCEGSLTTTDESRIVNGYAVTARDTGDCAAGATRPCFRLLLDFAVWVKDDYRNSLNMVQYMNDNFGVLVADQIMSQSTVLNAQLVNLEMILN